MGFGQIGEKNEGKDYQLGNRPETDSFIWIDPQVMSVSESN
jgi:hypothetical protein